VLETHSAIWLLPAHEDVTPGVFSMTSWRRRSSSSGLHPCLSGALGRISKPNTGFAFADTQPTNRVSSPTDRASFSRWSGAQRKPSRRWRGLRGRFRSWPKWTRLARRRRFSSLFGGSLWFLCSRQDDLRELFAPRSARSCDLVWRCARTRAWLSRDDLASRTRSVR